MRRNFHSLLGIVVFLLACSGLSNVRCDYISTAVMELRNELKNVGEKDNGAMQLTVVKSVLKKWVVSELNLAQLAYDKDGVSYLTEEEKAEIIEQLDVFASKISKGEETSFLNLIRVIQATGNI